MTSRGDLWLGNRGAPIARHRPLNVEIYKLHQRFVFDEECEARGLAGKLSMGIGGINACVLSRPWEAST